MIKDSRGKKLLFFWLLIGLLCRLIFMPFTMHPDILHIYYHPYFFAFEGVWNIYKYHADYFREHRYHYYAPLTYLFFGSYLYLIQPFLPGFDRFIEDVRNVSDQGGGHSGHYLKGVTAPLLFRFLFLMKLPYLFFDIALLALLLKFMPCSGYKWWALNPLLIYTCYLFGQFDIIPTFLIALAAYLAFNKKNILAMLCLGCASALKSFPIFLIFPFSFCLGRSIDPASDPVPNVVHVDIKGIIKYILIGVLPLIIIVGPYYFLSHGKVMGAFFSERITQRLGVASNWGIMRAFLFVFGYLTLCLGLLRDAMRQRLGRLWAVKISFFTLSLLFIAFPISFHYFLWIMPFIFILGCNLNFKIMKLYLLAIFSLGLVTLAGKGVCFGLFSPIHAEFFMGLPSMDEVINRVVPYSVIKRLAYFIFIGTLVWMNVLVLRDRAIKTISRHCEER